ncbi:hypothetical protein RND81_11G135600 [Saponaria officinalis]|uniref:GAG-pre-integrase domain-containing protein n=1 Tax=Saponaria officinalis TaxID=3572 RepID=A0AAW1HKP2_SAPOF
MSDTSTDSHRSTPTPPHSPAYEFYDDPLYLSSSDQPNLSFVSYQFDGSDFLMWKKDVLMALTAKNKDVFVDGRCRLPARTDKKHHQWFRCDLMIMKWILNSLHKSIRENLVYVHTSKQLWSELNERYGEANSLELYHLRKDLGAITQDNLSLVEYYGKMKRTWEDIDSLDPTPECSCERQKQLSDTIDALGDAAVFAATKSHTVRHFSGESSSKRAKFDRDDRVYKETDRMFKECTHCHKKGHNKDECYKLQDCSYCHAHGHVKEQCYKLRNSFPGRGRGSHRGDEESSPAYTQPHAQSTDHIRSLGSPDMVNDIVNTVMSKVLKAFSDQNAVSNATFADANFAGICSYSSAFTVDNTITSLYWITDTGASDHMTPNADLLHNIRQLHKPLMVVLPDGNLKLVHQVGSIRLLLGITLDTVLIVPQFKHNLLSVGRLIQRTNLCVTFMANKCWIQDLSSKDVLATVEKQGDLFRLQQQLEDDVFCTSVNTKSVTLSNSECVHASSVSLLHNRLGHTSFEKLKHVPDFQLNKQKDFFCETCILSKHHVLPFPRSHSFATKCFELLHMDVWGPYKTPTLTGARSFLTIVDDHSRGTWTFLFQSKLQVPALITHFLTYIEKQFHARVISANYIEFYMP